jgi:peptidoglycan/xylan/chitin deacetylase (PgdA/CDA1 family)
MTMSQTTQLWPGDKLIAVVFDVCLEGWSDGKAPGISPMGNPLPPASGVIDTMAISWAAYGVNKGIGRILDIFAEYEVRANMLINGVIAERSPEVVARVAEGSHEIAAHSFAMDLIPALQSEDDERSNIERCKELLEAVSGQSVEGWISPRATPSVRTEALLAEAGYTWHGDVLDRDWAEVRQAGGRQIVALPFDTDVNDMPLVKYGRHPKSMPEAFLENVEIARASDQRSLIDVTIHAHIGGHVRPAHFFRQIVSAAASSSDVWVCTRRELADVAIAQHAR